MNQNGHTSATLVLGGTGKTGRLVAERLRTRGATARAGSRAADPAFDWERPASWGPALQGVSSVYISYYPDLAVPGAAEAVHAFTDRAVKAGVRRLVLLSGRGEDQAGRAERAVQQAGVEWTIVRCAWFNQNFSENYLLEPVLAGEVALPAGDVAEPFVDAGDIADVAVEALTGEGHAGEVYELTGPRLLTFAEAVGEIARAARREIAYVPVSVQEYTSMLAAQDVPAEFVSLLGYLFSEVLDGRNAHLGDGIQRALGREPRDFSGYAHATAASGIWNPAAGRTTAA